MDRKFITNKGLEVLKVVEELKLNEFYDIMMGNLYFSSEKEFNDNKDKIAIFMNTFKDYMIVREDDNIYITDTLE